jgi:hypothetical protein
MNLRSISNDNLLDQLKTFVALSMIKMGLFGDNSIRPAPPNGASGTLQLRVADTAFLLVSSKVAHVIGYTGLGVGFTRFAWRPCSTCSMAETPSARFSPWSRSSPWRSRPSPSGGSSFVSASGPSGAPTSTRGVGTCGSRPRTSSASASTPRKPEPRPRGPGFWLGDATMSAGYPSEPKFTIDSISAALSSRGCSPRATFSLSTK